MDISRLVEIDFEQPLNEPTATNSNPVSAHPKQTFAITTPNPPAKDCPGFTAHQQVKEQKLGSSRCSPGSSQLHTTTVTSTNATNLKNRSYGSTQLQQTKVHIGSDLTGIDWLLNPSTQTHWQDNDHDGATQQRHQNQAQEFGTNEQKSFAVVLDRDRPTTPVDLSNLNHVSRSQWSTLHSDSLTLNQMIQSDQDNNHITTMINNSERTRIIKRSRLQQQFPQPEYHDSEDQNSFTDDDHASSSDYQYDQNLCHTVTINPSLSLPLAHFQFPSLHGSTSISSPRPHPSISNPSVSPTTTTSSPPPIHFAPHHHQHHHHQHHHQQQLTQHAALTLNTTSNQLSSQTHPHPHRRFVCTFADCGKAFSQSNHLTAHRRLHTGERPFVCDVPNCNRDFAQLAHLTSHRRMHTGERPFICDFADCGRAFSQPTNLSVHRRTHDSQISKPHQCQMEGCGKMYSARARLRQHILKAHGVDPARIDISNWTLTDAQLRMMHASKTHTQADSVTQAGANTGTTVMTQTSKTSSSRSRPSNSGSFLSYTSPTGTAVDHVPSPPSSASSTPKFT